jgi:hypothetical protein
MDRVAKRARPVEAWLEEQLTGCYRVVLRKPGTPARGFLDETVSWMIVEAKTGREAMRDAEADREMEGFAAEDVEPYAKPGNANQLAILLLADAAFHIRLFLEDDARMFREGTADEDAETVRELIPDHLWHLCDAAVVDRFIELVEPVAGKLARYPSTYLSCPAEDQVALRILMEAEQFAEDREDAYGIAFSETEGDAALRRLREMARSVPDNDDLPFEDWFTR